LITGEIYVEMNIILKRVIKYGLVVEPIEYFIGIWIFVKMYLEIT
jgi:hypothetical protein